MKQNMNMTDRHSEGVAREKQGSSYTVGILNEYGKSMPTVGVEFGKSMGRVWLQYASEVRRRCHGDLRSWERGMLRYAVMMVVIVFGGVTGAWGQTPDYSGTYYIASNGKPDNYTYNPSNPANNYYLCPTENWISYGSINTWTTGDDKPFLTTYKCRSAAYHSGDASDAVWIIEKHQTEDYYYIKHKSDGKYMVSNGQISGSTNANRMRVHIETVAQADLDEKALFSIKTYSLAANGTSPYLLISPKSEDGWNPNQKVDNRTQDLKWYSVNNGNQDYLQGNTKTDGPGGRATGGVIGLYTEYDINAQFFFEDVITRPTITCTTSNQIEITAAQNGTNTIKYTTDGSTPSADNGETYSAAFTLPEGVTTIKAIAVGTDWVSNVATFTNQKCLIQSQNNAWNTTDFHFYMIPGDEDNSIIKVNTTSLFRPSMEWTFQSASVEKNIQYYYIINNSKSKYLCYDATNSVVYMDDFGSGGDNFKFFLVESSLYPGKFYIKPYGQDRLISKNNGNTSADPINTVGNGNNINNISLNALWKFILPSELDTDPPFMVCDVSTHITKFYKIANVGSSGYYIVPPTGNNINATTSISEDASVVKSGKWYFEEAQAATASDWCTYYHIRNAETGKYLYFTKDANDAGACLEMKDAIESGNEERYKFTWARTATENTYYIIPKFVKDASQNQFSTLRRDGGTLKSNLTRGAGTYAWTFDEASLFCHNMVFEESGGNIIMSCNTNAAVIRYTTNGQDPKADGVTYLTYPPATPLSTSDQHLIKAYAVVSDGINSAASDDVMILLNKPDIILAAGPYTYKGTAWTPSLLTVSIGETGSETTAPTSPATYTATYANNVNAGTANVTLADADPTDNWYIWNGSTTFTIDPAVLTITADAKSKGYRDVDPELTYTYSGLVGGESIGDNLTGALGRETGDNVGTYAINIGTLSCSSGNYSISFSGATFTITAKSLGSGIAPATGITIDDITKSGNTYSVPGINHNSTPLTVGTEGTAYDYSLTTDDSNPKYHIVTFTGANNYTGSVSAKFVNVDFHPNSGSTEWTSSFVIGSSEGAFATPMGYTAHIVTGASGNDLTAPSLSYIPENVPVILLSTASSNGFMAQPTSGAAPVTSGNLLTVATGTEDQRTFTAGQIYILYNGEFVLNAAGTLAAGKIYLPKSAIVGGSTPAPSRLFIDWGESTSIKSIDDLTIYNLRFDADAWYTLDGRRLNGKPAKKGLYLRNGQKIVVR